MASWDKLNRFTKLFSAIILLELPRRKDEIEILKISTENNMQMTFEKTLLDKIDEFMWPSIAIFECHMSFYLNLLI